MIKDRGVLTKDSFRGKTPQSLDERVLTKRELCGRVLGLSWRRIGGVGLTVGD